MDLLILMIFETSVYFISSDLSCVHLILPYLHLPYFYCLLVYIYYRRIVKADRDSAGKSVLYRLQSRICTDEQFRTPIYLLYKKNYMKLIKNSCPV